jgi:hypothetical protein
MPSRDRQTADAVVAAFNIMDVDTLISLRTPTCKRVFLPASLKYPPQTNDEYRDNLNSMKHIFQNFQVTVDDVIEGKSENGDRKKIVMFVRARGDTPVGEYINEYVWRMGFDESGEKVDEWAEYVDVVCDST